MTEAEAGKADAAEEPGSPGTHAVQPPPELNPRREPVLDFADRPLDEMTAEDYDRLGFMAGLEVHQQLLTDSKLFCRCPAGRRVEDVDAEVLRHMRPTLSELGEYDRTALMEFKTRKEIVYLLERGTVCTYEMDDTPPFHIDETAVRIAVEIAELCGLNLVSELHVMRKQYLDGSIPTGFQRTAMVGLTGAIPLRVPSLGIDRTLRIRQLSLEEDSCREVADVGHRITFRTDRLGMPLTELVTEPDLVTPWELQAGADLLARVARSTGKVRRGAGAARQDVNVSVAGGRRVEIKGVPHHRGLPLLTHNEAFRQLNLLRVREALGERGVTHQDLPDPPKGRPWETSSLVVDARPILRRSDFRPMRNALERGDAVVAVRLPGFAGRLGHRTQPGRTFAHELAERVRVIACPIDRPFLAHTDADRDTLNGHHWAEIRTALDAGDEDALVVVWASADDAATAARELIIRAREALAGVPAETRMARDDMTTGFERLLPGPDRMYPDTDTPPLPISDTVIAEVRDAMRETPWDRAARYRELGLDEGAAHTLAGAPWADLFDAMAPEPGDVARRLAEVLRLRVPFYARRVRAGALDRSGAGGDQPRSYAGEPSPYDGVPPADRVAPLVRALEAGTLRPGALVPALDDVVMEPDRAADQIVDRYRAMDEDDTRLGERVREVARTASSEGPTDPEARLDWGMGEVMGELRGRVDARAVRERLAEALGVDTETGAEVTA
ncbi:MAG: Glu-tRNA(Gln) amidotransferase subunit GatE [Candidatus Longimicrobiales bacterium M2_2A_002]